MILPYCHDDIRALKNCCMTQTKVALLSKSICFAEQINLLCKGNQFVLLSKSIYFAFASAAYLYETSVSQHITPTSATPSATVRKQEDSHGFSADKRWGISAIEVKFPRQTLNNTKSSCLQLLIIYNFVLDQLSVGEKFRNFAFYITMWLIAMWHR